MFASAEWLRLRLFVLETTSESAGLGRSGVSMAGWCQDGRSFLTFFIFTLLFSAVFQVLQRRGVPFRHPDLRRADQALPAPWNRWLRPLASKETLPVLEEAKSGRGKKWMICLWKKNNNPGTLSWAGPGRWADLLTPPPRPFAPQLAAAAGLFSVAGLPSSCGMITAALLSLI